MSAIAITGAARGIGLATAEALAAAGHSVALGDLDGELAVIEAARLGPGCLGGAVDVGDEASFTAFLDRVEDELGPLDVLVNNAGVMVVGPFLDESARATELMLRVNVLGVVHGTRLAARRMAGRGGQVINVASMASWVAPPGEATYAATKHAVRGLSRAAREELRPLGVRVAVVMPGVVATELAAGTTPGKGKLLQPAEVAATIAGLVAKHRDEVHVPREAGVMGKLWATLPVPAARRLSTAIGLHDVAGSPDAAARAAYEERVLSGPR